MDAMLVRAEACSASWDGNGLLAETARFARRIKHTIGVSLDDEIVLPRRDRTLDWQGKARN
jgi:hypothetical protein